MFDSVNIEAAVAQTIQLIGWTLSQLPRMQAEAERALWDQSPWWMRLLLALASLETTYLVARRMLVASGVASRKRRHQRRGRAARR